MTSPEWHRPQAARAGAEVPPAAAGSIAGHLAVVSQEARACEKSKDERELSNSDGLKHHHHPEKIVPLLLSEKIIHVFNEQVGHELGNSNQYLSIANYFESEALFGPGQDLLRTGRRRTAPTMR